MARLGTDYYPTSAKFFSKHLRQLVSKPLLHLQSARKHINNAGNLAKTDYLFSREITYAYCTEKREKMMFT